MKQFTMYTTGMAHYEWTIIFHFHADKYVFSTVFIKSLACTPYYIRVHGWLKMGLLLLQLREHF